MLKSWKAAPVAASAALGLFGIAHANAPDLSAFDARAADSWARKLVLCDTTAFLLGHPDLNANVILVRRDDAQRFDVLLPPQFVGGGQWYKDGYERLFWRLRGQKKVDYQAILDAQNTVGRDFVEAYRRHGWLDPQFLRAQDSYCRAMARENGAIVS